MKIGDKVICIKEGAWYIVSDDPDNYKPDPVKDCVYEISEFIVRGDDLYYRLVGLVNNYWSENFRPIDPLNEKIKELEKSFEKVESLTP